MSEAYGQTVDPTDIRRRKRRANKAVLAGLCLIIVALMISSINIAPQLLTTLGAIIGLTSIMYGVHVGWLIFYEQEPDGPPS